MRCNAWQKNCGWNARYGATDSLAEDQSVDENGTSGPFMHQWQDKDFHTDANKRTNSGDNVVNQQVMILTNQHDN